jgi:hypothetical protein
MRIDDPARINACALEPTEKSKEGREWNGKASLERSRLQQAVAQI